MHVSSIVVVAERINQSHVPSLKHNSTQVMTAGPGKLFLKASSSEAVCRRTLSLQRVVLQRTHALQAVPMQLYRLLDYWRFPPDSSLVRTVLSLR